MEKNIIYWNPWWNKSYEPKDIVDRIEYNNIKKLMNRNESIFLTGIRRCGKTTAMYYLIDNLLEDNILPENILYINLDDEILKYEKLEDIYQKYKTLFPKVQDKIYIFLDEVQNITDWQRWVKNKYDSNENIKFIITGSKSHILKSERETLLTGRMFEIEFFPFSFKEMLSFNKIDFFNKVELTNNENVIKNSFLKYLEYGGFPEVLFEEDDDMKYLILKEYFKNIRNKDIINYFGIKQIKKFEKLTIFLISNLGKYYSANKIGKVIDLSPSVVEDYIDYSNLVYLFIPLLKFDYSVKKQLINQKKIYTIDTGFVNAISFKFSENKGSLLENLVFIELKRQNKEIYYHKQKKECDFVIKEGLDIVQAIQVTNHMSNDDTRKREFEGLLDACKAYNLKEGLMLTQDEEGKEIRELKLENGEKREVKIIIKPIWKWLLE
ncbi:MAG: ATP-binding protein [Nanoarchaeota archaeon]